jgi:aldehyde dehydrogenase (NAD+)
VGAGFDSVWVAKQFSEVVARVGPASGRVLATVNVAGLPAGVVNVVPGRADAGAALVAHPGVDKLSFTGGAATGRHIAAACAATCKPLVLELGGKSANIVFPDADVTRAVSAALGVISLSGQGCTVPSRLVVHESIFDRFVPTVLDALRAVPLGDPFDPATVMGPVVSAAACDRIIGMIARARDDAGNEVLLGGERLGGRLADGYFIPPTVISAGDPHGEISRDEVFGPVLTVFRFTDEQEAIDLANDTPYGLAGYIQTADLDRALRVAAALDVGNVGINGGHAPAGPAAPFGGVKQSGYGRQGGRAGIAEFIRPKNVMIQLT